MLELVSASVERKNQEKTGSGGRNVRNCRTDILGDREDRPRPPSLRRIRLGGRINLSPLTALFLYAVQSFPQANDEF